MLSFLTLPLLLLAPDAQRPQQDPAEVWEYLSEKYDADGDGEITFKEYGREKDAFQNLDRDGDGVLTRQDAEAMSGRGGRGRGRGGGGADYRSSGRAPKVGDKAPKIELPVLVKDKKERDAKDEDEKPKEFDLADFKSEKPVALVFGSYT